MKNSESTPQTLAYPNVHPPFASRLWRLLALLTLCMAGFPSAPLVFAQGSPPVAPDAPTYQQLKSFGKPSSGGGPLGVMVGTVGALYGTTQSGGSSGSGTVFRLNLDGTGFNVLKGDFDYSTTGGSLSAGLMQ